jgi:CHAT domain-containing protein
MDETRAQAYQQLIETFLNCPNGEEPQILQANSELLDAEFLQVCEVIAENLAEEDQENAANFLRNLASQLGEFLGFTSSGGNNADNNSPRDYLDFLQLLVQTEEDNFGEDSYHIYTVLQANIDKMNPNLISILRTTMAGSQIEKDYPEQSEKFAALIENIAIKINKFHRGNRAENIEIAIAAYEIVLSVRTFENNPEGWAKTQSNLANAYSVRIRGDKLQNIEYAICCYQEALKVRTRDTFPQNWATTQNNLAAAYYSRLKGEKADNIEKAIASFTATLEIRTRNDFPEQWAETQNNLGEAYRNRIRGDKAENIENAIAFYNAALEVYTSDDFSKQRWAETQNNLGEAYRERIRGDKAENIENAIAFYNAALKVLTHEAFPEYWATTQNNLAIAFCQRIKEEKADNIEQAIASYTVALEVFTHEAFPQEWAMTQNNLGNAYRNKITDNRAENIDTAIACFQLALEVYTREDFPQNWAQTQNNLGNAYSNKITRNGAENIDTAIKCFRQALEILTPSAFPLDCLNTGRNLGDLAFELQDWENAIYGYENAITAVEQSREWAGTEAAKQEIQENAIDVYFQMLQTCINAKNLPKALETVERSKARNLVELLATRDLYPKGNIPQEILDQLDRLRRNIPAIQRHLGQKTTNQSSQSTDDTEKQLRSELTALQQQLDRVLAQIKIVDPDFNLTQRVEVIPYSEIRSLAANNTAIIEWYITRDKFLAFVIAPNSLAPIVWQSSTADFNNLENWNNEYVGDYRNNNAQWQQTLAEKLQRLAVILHLDELLNLIPPTCDRLVLIPHSYLHLFPLHALPSKRQKINKESSQLYTPTGCLLDLFSDGVSYAPSCQLLQLAKKRHRPNFSHLFAIANPTKDRYLLELQAANIRQGFQSDSFWQRDNANKQAILNDQLSLANCAHFGCHGEFKPAAPEDSALILANKERLTLLEILTLNLSQCRLVTLSACETGLTKTSTADEYIGLPFGFLLAGSPGMVSTLWKVDQLASTLLLIRFYENIKTLSTVAALNEAQQRLRNLTSEGLEAVLEHLKPQIDQTFEQLLPGIRRRFVDAPQNRARNRPPLPFAKAHYWAAFTAIGV